MFGDVLLRPHPPNPTMNRTLARVISYLGHPLLVLTYVLLIMLAINPYAFGAHWMGDERTVVLLLYVVSTTFLIPGLGVSLLRPLGLIKSLEMEDKMERTGAYIITGIFYLWMIKNFMTGGVPLLYAKFVLGATIALFFAFFANIFTKISIHTTGMGAMVMMLGLLAKTWPGKALALGPCLMSLNVVLIVAVLWAGLVGSARRSLGAHRLPELWLGYAVGAVAVLLGYLVL